MKVFEDNYSNFYDLFYSNKNYKKEANDFIEKFKSNPTEILELGCGTGNYSKIFLDKGIKVFGVELSASMLSIAKKKFDSNFFGIHSDIENFQINRKFNHCLSLFHVISYLTDSKKVLNTFQNINDHLNPEGEFVFDCWHTAGVYSGGLETRVKSFEDNRFIVKRISIPKMNLSSNTVDVCFDYFITNKSTGTITNQKENHLMRHFSILEIEELAKKSGFYLRHVEESFSKGKYPSESSFCISVVLKKN